MYSKYTWFNLTTILLLQTYYLTKSRPTSSFRFEHLYFFRSCPKIFALNIGEKTMVCPRLGCVQRWTVMTGALPLAALQLQSRARADSNEEQKGTKLYLSRRKNGKGGNILKINQLTILISGLHVTQGEEKHNVKIQDPWLPDSS